MFKITEQEAERIKILVENRTYLDNRYIKYSRLIDRWEGIGKNMVLIGEILIM